MTYHAAESDVVAVVDATGTDIRMWHVYDRDGYPVSGRLCSATAVWMSNLLNMQRVARLGRRLVLRARAPLVRGWVGVHGAEGGAL